jgi:ABC-type branched-subunit amino acid transport system substrate-binding protein
VKHSTVAVALGALAALFAVSEFALGADTPGVTATEIKLGQNAPYSGPASAYGNIAKAEVAYMQMVNDLGGVAGRKINLISLDDGYSPPKTVEVIRKLVEEEQVAALFQTIGTAPNTAIVKYTNMKKVPDIWMGSGASVFTDQKRNPWSIPFQPSYRIEGAMFAKYILKTKPDAKVAIIYQNDDLGRDYVLGMKDGLGDKYGTMVVKEVSYEITDPVLDSQVISAKDAGADTILAATTPKFTPLVLRKLSDLNWHPLVMVDSNGNSVNPALTAAGLDKAVGVVTAFYLKDVTDPEWKDDPGVKRFMAWLGKYAPGADPADIMWTYGYNMAQAMVFVLEQCKGDFSRENIMKQATSLEGFTSDVMLPGVTANTSATDYRALKDMRLARFDGTHYVLLPQ